MTKSNDSIEPSAKNQPKKALKRKTVKKSGLQAKFEKDLGLLVNPGQGVTEVSSAAVSSEKKKRVRTIYNCVIAALSEVSGTPTSRISMPMVLADQPLEIDSEGEYIAVASRVSACLGKVIGSATVRNSTTVGELVNNVYQRIYGEEP
ncbi:MAG: hypothetical protein EOP86_12005 [Verrucomicrobiaceae bacterium]|nr:MAG: hypothetical protein EOP86_12005 [Verrucomicrobiaceae bacterium]